MSVTLAQATRHLNLPDPLDAGTTEELTLLVDAVNEWVAARVTDTTPATVQLGSLYLIQYWWRPQRGPANGDVDLEDLVAYDGATFPNRVLQLLGLGPWTDNLGPPSPAGDFPDAVAWPDPVEWPVS